MPHFAIDKLPRFAAIYGHTQLGARAMPRILRFVRLVAIVAIAFLASAAGGLTIVGAGLNVYVCHILKAC